MGMSHKFKEKKTTQAAAYLLNLHGGQMSFIKLLKLLYLADRESLIKNGRPITFDSYCSMDHGPVLSSVYNKIKEGKRLLRKSYWHRYIERTDSPEFDSYEVRLIRSPSNEMLSQEDERILFDVYHTHKHLNKWQLVHRTHELPEWRDPEGSSVPIKIKDILCASGFSEEDAIEVEENLDAVAYADRIWA